MNNLSDPAIEQVYSTDVNAVTVVSSFGGRGGDIYKNLVLGEIKKGIFYYTLLLKLVSLI